jgi:hypothetical protein
MIREMQVGLAARTVSGYEELWPSVLNSTSRIAFIMVSMERFVASNVSGRPKAHLYATMSDGCP